MILPLQANRFEVVAVDLADPHDLSGGSHDYVFLRDVAAAPPSAEVAPDLNGCLRAEVPGGIADPGVAYGARPSRLAYDTTTQTAIATFTRED